jgi:hypothetical protein
MIIIVVGVAAGVALLAVIAVVLARRSRGYPEPTKTWRPRAPIQPDLTLRRPVAESTLICPYCGEANIPQAKFCKNCGANLQE